MEDYRDVPLSNFDLNKWYKRLNLQLKGIFAGNEYMSFHHSPCIIKLDDFGNIGTHWVCCWKSGPGEYDDFDSFGLPPPLEWEKELENRHITPFLRNTNQLQEITSVRCGYYCLLFLNETKRGTSYENILKMFSNDLQKNERTV